MADGINRPRSGSAEQPSAAGIVLDRHLGAFAGGIDAIMADYASDAILITEAKTFTGAAEIKKFFETFLSSASEEFWADFDLRAKTIRGNVAYIVWSAKPFVTFATDTLIVKNDRIVLQTFASC